jgi:hypothetical protein
MLHADNGGFFIRAIEKLLTIQDWMTDEKQHQYIRFIRPEFEVGAESEVLISYSPSFERYSSAKYTVIYHHRLLFQLNFVSLNSKRETTYELEVGDTNHFSLIDAAGITRKFLQQEKDKENYFSVHFLWDAENHGDID